MNIGLIDVDGHNFPNLALMKISAWAKNEGHNVEWWNGLKYYDVVCKSKIFDGTYSKDIEHCINADQIVEGGTGYKIKNNNLPEEVEHIYPDYRLYLIKSTAYGFLTRGCPRNCAFCIVSKKEGCKSIKVADLSEFWKEQRYIKLLDPNLLACKKHEQLLQQLADSRAFVDFTQGLDIRLTNRDNIQLLNQIRTKRLHFAWDNPDEDLTDDFKRFARYARIKDPSKRIVYVLTNFGSTQEQDLYRVYTLRDLGFNPYIMVYDKPSAPRQTKLLQRWCNNRIIFGAQPNFSKYDPTIG
ncbi:radical SAM protein [Clostridiales Family XIII bacterium ASD5510]|uniref:Radical SAM protein n=1 Tax=Hominibacterium faecale TaxID=2839743 RepID=A0A9J6QYC0_9FIRM|nr:radical SAM protein [Hominibacterium faecale]MCU7380489.1 radical SAM protein [Hominibacterium faecale]